MVTVRERVRIFTPELQLHTRTGQGYNSASEAEARVGRPRPSSVFVIFLNRCEPSHARTLGSGLGLGGFQIEGRQRPNLKSEDSGLRACFSEAKVSLWMCENGTGHEEARGPTRR